MQEGLITVIAGMIKDVYPVAFISLVIVSIIYWYVFLVWRPYIKGLQRVLEELISGREENP
jgi:hypothetical protein